MTIKIRDDRAAAPLRVIRRGNEAYAWNRGENRHDFIDIAHCKSNACGTGCRKLTGRGIELKYLFSKFRRVVLGPVAMSMFLQAHSQFPIE